MKALTVLQPWASLIAFGEKTVETRSWKTNYRGQLAIHSSQRFQTTQMTTCWHPLFAQALIRHGIEEPEHLPLGQMLCIVTLVDVIPVEVCRAQLNERELGFGNYAALRYAWMLELVDVFEKPIPATGHQGLWEWTR